MYFEINNEFVNNLINNKQKLLKLYNFFDANKSVINELLQIIGKQYSLINLTTEDSKSCRSLKYIDDEFELVLNKLNILNNLLNRLIVNKVFIEPFTDKLKLIENQIKTFKDE